MRAHRALRHALLVLGLLAAVADVAPVEAQVAVNRIRGPRGAAVQRSLVRHLGEAGHEVVSEDSAVLIVSGRITRRGGRLRGRLNLTDASGESQGRVTGSARGVGGLAAQLARRLGNKLAEHTTDETTDDEQAPEPEASSDGMRVVVGGFRGRGGSRIRNEIVRVLSSERGVSIVAQRELDSAASALGVDLSDADGLVRASARARVSAYISGSNDRQGGQWSSLVTVRNGEDGAEVESVQFQGRNLNRLAAAVRQRGWERLSAAIMQTNMPAESAGEVAEVDDHTDSGPDDGDDPEDAPVARRRTEPRYNTLDIAIQAHAFSRSLRYNDDLYGLLREYTLSFGPAIQLTGRWYPAARATNGFGAHLGLDVMWERAFAIDSKRADGSVFPTRSQAWYLGLRGRMPFGAHEASLGVGYGKHSFIIDAGPSQPGRVNIPQVPGVDYTMLKIQLETRLAPIGGLRVTLQAAYLLLLDVGGIEEGVWFPRANAGGIEAGIMLGYETDMGIEIRIGWDVRRYFYSFSPEPGDPFIVGGAVDQYFGYTLGLAYRL